MFWVNRFVVGAMLLMVIGCDSAPVTPTYESSSVPNEISVAELKLKYLGSAHPIVDVATIRGIITANNIYGEFPNTFIVEDSSGAIEVSADVDDMLGYYSVGRSITLQCSNLWLSSRGDVVVLGCEPTSDSVVDAISQEELEWRAVLSEDGVIPTSKEVTIADLRQSMVSRYLLFRSMHFVSIEVGDTFCLYDVESGGYTSGLHTLEDDEGRQIELYVPWSVRYAARMLPTQIISLIAILESYSGRFSLRPANCYFVDA